MDVSAAEFEEKLPRLQELILACDFVGKTAGLGRKNNYGNDSCQRKAERVT